MAKGRVLNAYITETPELALEQAKQSDERRRAGRVGLLEGIPVANKDLYCTKGVRTTAASKILSNFVPTRFTRPTRCRTLVGFQGKS